MRISDWSSDVCSSDLTAIERVGAQEMQRPGNRPLFGVISDEQNDPVRHVFAHQVERFAREVWMPPFARAGVLIEKPHRIPMLGTDRVAGTFLDAQALDRAQPFLAKLLALLRVQRAKEIVEAGMTLVRDMKLDCGGPGH